MQRSARSAFLTLLCVALGSAIALASPPSKARIFAVKRIWDHAPHNAFTDLIRFQNQWWCVFREAATHLTLDGKLRVLSSTDGDQWKSVALIELAGEDLRDPKFSITPQGGLMMICGGARAPASNKSGTNQFRSWATYLGDGEQWTKLERVGEENYWMWRVAWLDGTLYGTAYSTRDIAHCRLYLCASRDGHHFERLVPEIYGEKNPNEATLLFEPDGHCLCLARRSAPAVLGSALAPYKEWKWTVLNQALGGPNLIRLPDGRKVAGGRVYLPKKHMGLLWLDEKAGKLTEFLALPSGGDCSYPGFVFHDGLLWVSYYSSHERGTNIYLARVELPAP